MNSFSSLDEAYEKYGEFMEAEKNMIETVIHKQSKKEGAAFSLKGIVEIYHPFYEHIVLYSRRRLIDSFNQYLSKTGSPFAELLTIDPQRKIEPETYLLAAEKLLGEIIIPEEIKNKMVLLTQMNTIQIRLSELFTDYLKYSICCWKFGKGRLYLEEGALRHGFTVKQTRKFIDLIDDELSNIY